MSAQHSRLRKTGFQLRSMRDEDLVHATKKATKTSRGIEG